MQELFQGLSRMNPFSRKQIFSDYKLPQDPSKGEQPVHISKDKKKNDQILLRQLRLFKFNLEGVLREKRSLDKKLNNFEQRISDVNEFLASFNQGQKDDSEQIRIRWRELCSQKERSDVMGSMRENIEKSLSESGSVQPAYLLKGMILYRAMLNVGKEIKYEAESFCLGTMSNFNQSTIKANFTKTPQLAQQSIGSYVEKIDSQSSKSMQSKIREMNDWQKQRFLLEDDKYNSCWKGLEELYNPKQVELVHFDMINLLNDFDQKLIQFSKMLKAHEGKYSKYQGVADSILLMERQIKEMQHVIKSKDQLVTKLAQQTKTVPQQYDPNQLEKLIEKQTDQGAAIHKNIKIYHINEKLFAHYNTETNLTSYYQLRKNYSLHLAQLQTRMEQWKEQFSVIKEISTNYSQIDDLLKKKAAVSSGNRQHKKYLTHTGTSDSQLVRLIVNLQDASTKKNPKLNSFKRFMIDKVKQRIGGDQVGNIRISSGPSSQQGQLSGKDSQILEGQKSFLLGLLLTPNQLKKCHLIKNSNLIEQYIVFNKSILKDGKMDKERVSRYLWQLQILQEILIVSRTLYSIKSGETSSEGFSDIIEEHLKLMWKKMNQSSRQDDSQIHELLCNHVYDYQLVSRLFSSQAWKEYVMLLDEAYEKDATRSFTFSSNSSDKKNLNELISFTQKVISINYLKPLENILHIFYESLFQTNHQISFQLFAFEHYFWETLCKSFSKLYYRTGFYFTQNMTQLSSLDPEDFLTIPCLTELIKSKIKVKNLDEIILKITKKLYNKLGDFHQDKLLENVLSLTYLINYLFKLYDPEDRKDKFVALNRLRRCLAVELMKLKYGKMYATSIQGTTPLSSRQICMILGIEKYLIQKDLSEKLDSKLQLTQNYEKYLSMIEKQIKPLTINVSPLFSSERTMTKIWNLQSFEQWFEELQSAVLDPKLSPLFFFAFLNILQLNLQELIKLVDSPQVSSMKESEGFLIKMIKKENFYLKTQISKFRLLMKEGVWEKFDKVIEDALDQLGKYSSINDRESKLSQLDDLKIKAKKILLNTDKKRF